MQSHWAFDPLGELEGISYRFVQLGLIASFNRKHGQLIIQIQIDELE